MISALVLAAGMSTRMGRTKQLLPYGEHTVIEQIVAALLASPADEIVVITGHQHDRVEAELERWPVRTVLNPDHAESEMLSSLQIGLQAVATDSQAALLVLGDMPALEADVVRQLIEAYQSTGAEAIYIPSYQMRAGHPVLIPRRFWEAILRLPPGTNPRAVLRGSDTPVVWVQVNTPSVLQDLDTPEDYQRELRRQNEKPAQSGTEGVLTSNRATDS